MDLRNGELIFSPTDLVKFIESPYSSWLDHYCLFHPEYKQNQETSERQNKLFQLGYTLEKKFYNKLKTKSSSFVSIPRADSLKNTKLEMFSGKEYIAQAHLKKDNFEGFADLLVQQKSQKGTKVGKYIYTVKDIKRSAVPKAKFIIQICCYIEMLNEIQGAFPEEAGIILGTNQEESFKISDYYDYYLSVKKLFLDFHNNFNENEKPTPTLKESLGSWEKEAISYLEKIDSLLLLPSIDSEDIKKLENNQILTRKELINCKEELNISPETLLVYQKEAFIQLSKNKFALHHYNPNEPKGLLTLPPISENDLFIDIKASDSYHKDELFYSFSTYSTKNGISIDYCFKKEFERGYIVKFLNKIKEASVNGNIYFYGNSVLDNIQKAVSSQGIFLETFDHLNFNAKLIDLQLILKQSIAIPFHNYSLENAIKTFNESSEFEDSFGLLFNIYYHEEMDKKDQLKIELEEQQTKYFNEIIKIFNELILIQKENKINFVPLNLRYNILDNEEEKENEESIDYNFNLGKYNEASESEKINLLLKQLIGFYKNEKRPKELEKIKLLNQTEVALEKNTRALSFLTYESTPDEEKPYIREYKFYKNQEYKIGADDSVILLQLPSTNAKVKEIDLENGKITLQFRQVDTTLVDKFKKLTIIENNVIRTKNLEKAVIKTAIEYDKDKQYLGLNKALFDFLSRNFPDVRGVRKGDSLYTLNEDLIDAAIRVVGNMNNSVLVIQGPPGAGKTFTTRKIVYDLILEGKKIAVSSNSHKAINNVINELSKDNPAINVVKFGGDKDDLYEGIKSVSSFSNLKDDYDIFGGTAFTLCNPELEQKFDYLFIDEAGQVSIPNLIAMSRCAKNIILIGDQMQLDQPLQGIHPADSGKSCLSYYLGDKKTIPQNLGFFLPITRRMNSELTKVISDNFYDGKLKSHENSDDRSVHIENKNSLITKSKGCVFIPMNHKNNNQYSIEEINVIKKLREDLIGSELSFDGTRRIIQEKDIIYVSPFNMQVKKIKEILGEELNAGSVDLFQGQEAPIVIISLASSESSSRGLEFLLKENRLNVAISRGQALAIVIGNKGIIKSSVGNLNELKLLNLYSKLSNE